MTRDLLCAEDYNLDQCFIETDLIEFKHLVLRKGDFISDFDKTYYYLFFVREGEVDILYNEHQRIFKAGEVFFIPRLANISGRALEDSDVLIHLFDSQVYIYDALSPYKLEKYVNRYQYRFESQVLVEPFFEYLSLLVLYLEEKLLCKHIQEIKKIELFLLFKAFYTKEQCTALFYPLLVANVDFKTKVLNNYHNAKTARELASKCCLSMRTFNRRFKVFFEETPYKWMLIQKSKLIQKRLCEPNVLIRDIVEEYGFSSSRHFSSFCKAHFNMTPSQLRKKLIAEKFK